MRNHTFKYKVGDQVIITNPLASWGIRATITQQIKPMTFPEGRFDSKNMILMPRTRKEYRPTRQISYLVKILDTELNCWVTEMCVSLDDNPSNALTNM